MARQTQIVPEKKYPYVETFYNDYSGWTDTETTTPVPDGFKSLCVFAASKGIDNKLLTKGSVKELIEEYGDVDFKHYGQAMLNAYKMLESGNALVHCMRVLPKDANYANVILMAKVKMTSDEGDEGTATTVPKAFKVDPKKDTNAETTTYNNYLSWTAVTSATGYEICINNETSNVIQTTEIYYSHDNIIPETPYTYKVRAILPTSISGWTNTVEVTNEAGTQSQEAVVAEETPATVKAITGMSIKFVTMASDALRTVDDIEAEFDRLKTLDEADADGYVSIPLFALYSLGRGTYGNNYSFRLVDSVKMTEEVGACIQQVELFDSSNGIELKERYYISMDSTVVVGNESMFIADVISNPTDGSGKIGAYGNEDAIDVIYDMYNNEWPGAVERIDFNIFTGIESDLKTAIPKLTIEAPDDDAAEGVSLSEATGLAFAYGSDGSLAVSSPNFETAMETCYKSAWAGEFDTGVLSKRRFPTQVILDAGYDLDTKIQMATTALKRGDCQLILDAGYLTTRYEVYNWADSLEIAAIEDWSISKTFQHGVVKDPFTGKSIKITDTYLYAKLLPFHYYSIGADIPMTGEDYGLCDEIVNNKLYPMVEYDDDTFKTGLVERHLNWIEAINTNTLVIGVQNTSQMANSDMVEMSNAAVLLTMKRELDSLCTSITYHFGEAADRVRYTKDAQDVLAPYKDMVREFEVKFDMNKWEEQRSIIHCYLSVTFKTIIKNVIVEIDINSRV